MAQTRTNILVTGGARRVGRAIVEDMARHGFGVAIHCRRSIDEAEALAASVRAAGGAACVVQADLADMAQTATLVDRSAALIGPVSIVVNNASVFEDDTAAAFGWDGWDRHFDIHVKAPVMIARTFAEHLAPGAPGLVVNMIDQRVLKPAPGYFSYTLSKSTLWSATRTMAQSFAPDIRVNAIGPGPTLPSSRQSQADFDAQVAALLLKRGPALTDFGATIRYLWETPSITGQLFALDGGQHLAWRTADVAGITE